MWATIMCTFLCYQDLQTAALHGVFNGIAISSIASDGIQVFWKDLPKELEEQEEAEEEGQERLLAGLTLIILE